MTHKPDPQPPDPVPTPTPTPSPLPRPEPAPHSRSTETYGLPPPKISTPSADSVPLIGLLAKDSAEEAAQAQTRKRSPPLSRSCRKRRCAVDRGSRQAARPGPARPADRTRL